MLSLTRMQAIKDEAATAGDVEGEDAGGGRIDVRQHQMDALLAACSVTDEDRQDMSVTDAAEICRAYASAFNKAARKASNRV